MNKIIRLLVIAALSVVVFSCDYDDTELSTRLDKIEARLSALEQMNQDLDDLRTILTKLQQNISVTAVTPTSNGYRIEFSDDTKIVIQNGEKGGKGDPGASTQGPQGPKGDTGKSPAISVALFEGLYYWTLDGEFVTDAAGKKIPVTGPAPKLKIDGDDWYVSYDDGATWSILGSISTQSTGFFSNVVVEGTYVIFTLASGESFELPISAFAFTLREDVACLPGGTARIDYVVSGASNASVECLVSGGYKSKAVSTSSTTGYILVTAPFDNGDGQVLVFVSNGLKTLVKAIVLSKGSLKVSSALTIDGAAQTVDVTVTTDVDYVAEVSESWMHLVTTKVEVHEDILHINIDALPSGLPYRVGKVNIKDGMGNIIESVMITQGDIFKPVACSRKYLVSRMAQTLDVSSVDPSFVDADLDITVDWITAGENNLLSIAENTGLMRFGLVTFNDGVNDVVLMIKQAPAGALFDIMMMENDVQPHNIANNPLETFETFNTCGKLASYSYSLDAYTMYNEDLMMYVTHVGNTVTPCSNGGLHWRNSSGVACAAMCENGLTIEMYLNYEHDYTADILGRTNPVGGIAGTAFSMRNCDCSDGTRLLDISICNSNGWRFAICGEDSVIYGTDFSGGVEPYPVENQFYHVAATWNPATSSVTVYIDGQRAAVRTGITSLPISTDTRFIAYNDDIAKGAPVFNPYTIGGALIHQQGSMYRNLNWQGQIAYCRVYPYPLTEDQITESCAVIKK